MRFWRECGLPEDFLDGAGVTEKLVVFAARIRVDAIGVCYKDRPPGFVAARRLVCSSPAVCFEFGDSLPVCGPCDREAMEALRAK